MATGSWAARTQRAARRLAGAAGQGTVEYVA